MTDALIKHLQAFVDSCRELGQEKQHGSTFLNRLFRAFGFEDAIAAGAEFEDAIAKASAQGHVGYADLLWRRSARYPGVLFEMKSRGTDLAQHRRQAERYWIRIVPNRPRYVVLCNFAEFWIYDFDNQIDEPVDCVRLEELPRRAATFNFMRGLERPIFKNNQVEVTERAARRMGEFYGYCLARGKRKQFAEFSEDDLQRFTLQCVLAMFAEDRGLLPSDLFTQQVGRCLHEGEACHDTIGCLFYAMNNPGIVPAGRYCGVDYFDGGLFAQLKPIELQAGELTLLEAAAKDDWRNVRPSIFGNIFEGAIEQSDRNLRHQYGIHYTAEVDIRQIVRPTITFFWEERIEQAVTLSELLDLQTTLQTYHVLDPACGSGNFLYVAYLELKEIELLLRRRIRELGGQPQPESLVTPLQFFGLDVNSFAVELARVTLMIARRIAIEKLELDEPSLPLDRLDDNIRCEDALFCEWPGADAIVGNPPFLGGKHTRMELGDDYMERVFRRFPEVKDSVDFCCYWFRLAHQALGPQGRAGLVGTNSVSQGKSRAASLDFITQNGGWIHSAISTQPWFNETDPEKRKDKERNPGKKANVHVSIINWSRQPPAKLRLDGQPVQTITSSLRSHIDTTQAQRLQANQNRCFQGVIPVGKGFLVTATQVEEWIAADSKNAEVLKLFSMGANLAKYPHGHPERWIIDFNDRDLETAGNYTLPFRHIKKYVKPQRDQNRRPFRKENWWKLGELAPKMRQSLAPLSQYFAVPEVSKWAIFIPCPLEWLPGNKVKAVASDDFYVLGILLSSTHRTWMDAQKSTLKADTAYTHTTCFETFPFPQQVQPTLVQKIRDAAQDLHHYRTEQMESKQWGITELYNNYFQERASGLFKRHALLDRLVLQAYGFKASDPILERLLELNAALAEQERHGQAIAGPWAPAWG
jgi:hypothetical protein